MYLGFEQIIAERGINFEKTLKGLQKIVAITWNVRRLQLVFTSLVTHPCGKVTMGNHSKD